MRGLVYIILAFILAGCAYSGTGSRAELDDAGRMIASDPQEALRRLNRYDVSAFVDSADMARWALLYSEAMAANNLSAPTDTIVGIAIDYYGVHNRQEEYRRALQLKDILASSGKGDELASALYLQKEKEFMLYRERSTRERYVFVGVILILGAAFVIVRQRQKIRVGRMHNDALMAEASALRESLASRDSQCSEMEAKLSSALASRFRTIDGLCDTYYSSRGSSTERKVIVEKVKSEIESLRADDGLFREMETAVNECHGNILDGLRTDMPGIRPDEYRMVAYLACGMSNRAIALLLDESIDVVYKRKSRLKARITSMESPRRTLYQSVFLTPKTALSEISRMTQYNSLIYTLI